MGQFTAVRCSNERWLWYAVRDAHGRFWSGKGWGEPSAALRFTEEFDAYKLALELTLGKTLRQFATTVNVIVEGDNPFTKEQLRRFLVANCAISNGSSRFVEGLMVTVDAAWDELTEIK